MSGQSNPAYNRCGYCNLSWPPVEDYQICPKCFAHTAVMTRPRDDIMTEAEAEDMVNHLKFESYVNQEHKAVHSRELFEAVIDGAGFTDEERKRIGESEALLPFVTRHQH